jgi:hypothetical protein
MSRILITGITALHCIENYYLRQELSVLPSQLALVTGLRELGHTVEQRPVKWGEDLSKYTHVITYLCATDSFVAAHTAGALWTLTREDTLIALDDWQLPRSLGDFLKPEAKWKDSFVSQMEGCDDREAADFLHSQWMCGRRVLLPAFEGGDPSLFFKKGFEKIAKAEAMCDSMEIHTFNPEPLLPLRRPKTTLDSKERQWIIAGLSETNRKSWKRLKPTLPVIEVGRRGAGGVRMPEDQIVDFFAQNWFHWNCKYDISGSGWWRAKSNQCSSGLVITVHESKEEAAIFGPSWVIDDPLSLETMSDSQLHDLAVRQRLEFVERHPTDEIGKARSLEKLSQFIQ